MLPSHFKHVLVGNVKLGLLEIDRTIAAVVLVKRKQTMLAVSANMAHEPRETIDHLRIGIALIVDTGRAHINLELETMKRMLPRAHLWIHESFRAADAEAGDVNVVIDQLLGIDIFESAFDEGRRLVAEFAVQLLGLLFECAADGMNETHYRMRIIVPSIVAMSSR